jgi:hypothetical protein
MSNDPTTRAYASLQAAFNFFNTKLFKGKLPHVVITMQRHKGAFGYFHGNRFQNTTTNEDIRDEIAMNPQHFAERPIEETLATLVHEMVHLWQHRDPHGKPPRTGYHNQQWARKMTELGLTPTDDGTPNGKTTGQRMHHMVVPNGPFAKACAAFFQNHHPTLYHDRLADEEAKTRKRKAASKTKYTCSSCGANAWAKPDTNLWCGDCEEPMEPADQPDESTD